MTHNDPIQGAVQEQLAPEDGDLLVGYVVVAEWLGSDGRKLTKLCSEGLTGWAANGYLFEALHRAHFE